MSIKKYREGASINLSFWCAISSATEIIEDKNKVTVILNSVNLVLKKLLKTSMVSENN